MMAKVTVPSGVGISVRIDGKQDSPWFVLPNCITRAPQDVGPADGDVDAEVQGASLRLTRTRRERRSVSSELV